MTIAQRVKRTTVHAQQQMMEGSSVSVTIAILLAFIVVSNEIRTAITLVQPLDLFVFFY